MLSRIFLIVLVVIIGTAITTESHAWDGQRKGFLFGCGFGWGRMDVEVGNWEIAPPGRKNVSDGIWKFKLGYAPSNHFQLYWEHKSFFSDLGYISGDPSFTNALSALGMSYYFNSQSPSPFLCAGYGKAKWTSQGDLKKGYGLFVGAGFEFVRNANIKFDFSYGNGVDVGGWDKSRTYVLTFWATVNLLGY